MQSRSRPSVRPYRSTLRASQALETRRRILSAAAELFAQTGYEGTSLAAIARSAGVSLETVKAAGPKHSLLLGAFEQQFGGDESREPLASREPFAAIVRLDDDAFLRAVSAFIAESNARTSGLWRAFRAAAQSEPTVADSLNDLLERRDSEHAQFVGELERRGLVGVDVVRDELVAEVTLIFSHEAYDHFVAGCGWPIDRYRAWLVNATLRSARG